MSGNVPIPVMVVAVFIGMFIVFVPILCIKLLLSRNIIGCLVVPLLAVGIIIAMAFMGQTYLVRTGQAEPYVSPYGEHDFHGVDDLPPDASPIDQALAPLCASCFDAVAAAGGVLILKKLKGG